MHSGSFIANTGFGELDDFRKEVRGKINSKFEQPKQILCQAKNTQLSSLHQLLRSSISPKSPKNNHLNLSQENSPQLHKTPGRLSFQRSSLDLNKLTQNILYPKKQLQDILPINKIIELQRAIQTNNYPPNSRVKKISKNCAQGNTMREFEDIKSEFIFFHFQFIKFNSKMAAQYNQIQYFFKPPTSPSFTSRISIIDQISPIKDILLPNSNRATQNPVRNSARGVPQLITTRTQPSMTRESCQLQRESMHIKQTSIHHGDQIGEAIGQLNLIKNKYDKNLESKIETVISLLRAQVFDKENCNPNSELRQQVITLQQSNEKLQNQMLQRNKENKSVNNLEQHIRNLENQTQYILNQRESLKQENEMLQVKLLNKEQQYTTLQQEMQQKIQQRSNSQQYEMLLNQQQQKINELEGLIASLRSLNSQESLVKVQDYQDLKWKFEQSIIAYQRKDKDWQQKIEDIRRLKIQVDQLNKRNQALEIKILEFVEQEVQQRIIR